MKFYPGGFFDLLFNIKLKESGGQDFAWNVLFLFPLYSVVGGVPLKCIFRYFLKTVFKYQTSEGFYFFRLRIGWSYKFGTRVKRENLASVLMGLCGDAPDLANPAFGLLANSPSILYCLKWRLFLRFQTLLFSATRTLESYLIDVHEFDVPRVQYMREGPLRKK